MIMAFLLHKLPKRSSTLLRPLSRSLTSHTSLSQPSPTPPLRLIPIGTSPDILPKKQQPPAVPDGFLCSVLYNGVGKLYPCLNNMVEVENEDGLGSEDRTVWADSVKRKRKVKMNKHKYKKRRKLLRKKT